MAALLDSSGLVEAERLAPGIQTRAICAGPPRCRSHLHDGVWSTSVIKLLKAGRVTRSGAEVVLFYRTASCHNAPHTIRPSVPSFDRPSRQPLGDHSKQSGRRFLIEGITEAIDEPGEFAVDKDQKLVYWPRDGEEEDDESYVATAGLSNLLHVEGKRGAPLQKLRFENSLSMEIGICPLEAAWPTGRRPPFSTTRRLRCVTSTVRSSHA